MIRVEGHQNLYRDERSGAIINCDSTSYNEYLSSLSIRDSQKKEIEHLKSEMSEIKNLLKELLYESRSN
jgi:hypothetical protein